MTTFHLSQPVDADPALVWSALSQPRGLAAWQADRVEGSVEPGARLALSWPSLGVAVEVSVTEWIPQRRLVLAWDTHRVTFEVDPGGVHLTCAGITNQDELEGTGSAWALSLATLAHYCEHHAERERSVCWLSGIARAEPELIHTYFTEVWAQRHWLGEGSGFGAVGSAVSIQLTPERALSGRVLAHTAGRDLLVSWEEDGESVLAFRSLPSPLGSERMVMLSWSRWNPGAPPDGHFSALQAAHRRLLKALQPGAA
ncbi:MAG: SRPBCC domain-containing protein [Polyangiaceae bacterium]